jgi:thiol-disulfide isomerase/thioredoxin
MQIKHWLKVRSVAALSAMCLVCSFLLASCASRNLASPLPLKPGVSVDADYQDINADGAMSSVKPRDYLARGKYTIVEFYSPYCPPCMALKPKVHELAAARKDIAVRAININRAGVEGIDWDSPIISENGGFRSVPYFRIYGPDNKLMADGEAAADQVLRALQAQFG